MAKGLKSVEEIHDTIKRRLFTDECVPHLVGLDDQIKYVKYIVKQGTIALSFIYTCKNYDLLNVDEMQQCFAAHIAYSCQQCYTIFLSLNINQV